MASLILVSDYKQYAGITSNKFDTQISTLVDVVSAIIKTHCNRSFIDHVTTDKIEYFNSGGDSLLVEEVPIISVTSLKIRSNPIEPYVSLTEDSDYIVEEGVITRIDSSTGSNKLLPSGPRSVELTYRAGFATVPSDLKIAAMDLLTFYMKKEATQEVMMMSKQPSNISRAHNNKQVSNFPPHIARVLNYYRILL